MRQLIILFCVSVLFCLFFQSALSIPILGKSLFKKQKGSSVTTTPSIISQFKNKPIKVTVGTGDENPFQYSGFIRVNETYQGDMYYVFCPALNNNVSAPIIMWLQGGPGASSMTGLFVENGPYLVDPKTLQLVKNEFTWNDNHHMLYVDNPLGSGFSHTKKPDVNLQGIGIGDGLTHPIDQFTTYAEFSFSLGLIDLKQRQVIEKYQNTIVNLIKEGKNSQAMDVNNDLTTYTITNCSGGVNVYDVRTYQDYDFNGYIDYVNLPTSKKLMHTEGITYHDENQDVWSALLKDIVKSVRYKVEALLNNPRKVRVLLYNGQYDWICNTIGQEKWIKGMNWHGKDEFNVVGNRKLWKVNGKIAGYIHEVDNLIQMVVNNAGHLSPMNQPENVRDMVRTFTGKKNF
ncbi:hypothetical protein ABK040_013700 [Willaertia magna]